MDQSSHPIVLLFWMPHLDSARLGHELVNDSGLLAETVQQDHHGILLHCKMTASLSAQFLKHCVLMLLLLADLRRF